MRNPTVYLKMRVLGAIDMAEGSSIQARIRTVSQMTFTDEDGHPRQFTWRTIQTWYSRFKKHGVTQMENKPRSDKGNVRKVVLEDIRKVLPKLHGRTAWRAGSRPKGKGQRPKSLAQGSRLKARMSEPTS